MTRWTIAGIALFVTGGIATAGDVIRLGGTTDDAPTVRLGGSSADAPVVHLGGAQESDTQFVAYHGHGGGGHYSHGGYGHGGYGHGGYGHAGYGHAGYGHAGYGHAGYGHAGYGHAGYYGHSHYGHAGHYGHYHYGHYPYYRSFYGWGWGGFYRPYAYYRPWYYSSYYYPSYYAPNYYVPSSYYSAPVYIDPCVTDGQSMPEAVTLGIKVPNTERAGPVMPPAPRDSYYPNPNGSYRYDGGPRQQAPMPGEESAPIKKTPPPPLPRDLKVVSNPRANAPSFSYPAYGETPSVSSPPPAPNTLRLVSTTTPQVRFPAYGEK